MPLRRTPRAKRETREARALREAVAADTAAMLARIPDDGKSKAERTRADAKAGRRFDRVMTKARAKWDAASPEWRQRQGAKILADDRRRDQAATLPADGGREIYAVYKLSDDGRRRRAKKSASTPSSAILHTTNTRAVTADAVRPAPVVKAEPVAEATPEPSRKRRRRPAGFIGYIDARLIDEDEWED
ncbi:hypothetical protein J7E45_01325 [Microbacterium sp. ISL-59]|uniref:hypothetical protein n=1 Tax=Microbacterium sp. ISL-59 TaxID=2819159 RepID=UPI001BEBE484|nr:hypothetical protein [Microbacterium sp. ISL-59]MBT2494236.1 hypothetical protein [Microbacterium sp. ISL-59]